MSKTGFTVQNGANNIIIPTLFSLYPASWHQHCQAGLHWLAGSIFHLHYLCTTYEFLPQMESTFW